MNKIAQAISDAGGAAAVAREANVSVQAVCFWRDMDRALPEKVAPVLERMSGGKAVCEELLPETLWHRIPDPDWPHPAGRPLIDVATKEPANA